MLSALLNPRNHIKLRVEGFLILLKLLNGLEIETPELMSLYKYSIPVTGYETAHFVEVEKINSYLEELNLSAPFDRKVFEPLRVESSQIAMFSKTPLL